MLIVLTFQLLQAQDNLNEVSYLFSKSDESLEKTSIIKIVALGDYYYYFGVKVDIFHADKTILQTTFQKQALTKKLEIGLNNTFEKISRPIYSSIDYTPQYVVAKFDKDFNLLKSMPLEPPKANNQERNLENCLNVGGKLYLFFTFDENHNKQTSLAYETLDLETLLPNNDIKKINDLYYKGSDQFIFSPDSSKLLVANTVSSIEKTVKEDFKIFIFDTKMNLIKNSQFTLPYLDKDFAIEDIQFTDNGEVYISGPNVYNDKLLERKLHTPTYQYSIFSYSPSLDKLTEYPIKITNKFLTDLRITSIQEDKIICVGFYSDYDPFTTSGSFFMTINKKNNDIEPVFYPFSFDFLSQGLTASQKKLLKKRLDNHENPKLSKYILKDVFVNNFGISLFGEQTKLLKKTHTSSTTTPTPIANSTGWRITTTTTTSSITYNYQNACIINFSFPDGMLKWETNIVKSQKTDLYFFSSFLPIYGEDYLGIIYNDNIKNQNYSKETKLYKMTQISQNGTFLVKINNNGLQKKKLLFTKKNTQIGIIPQGSFQINDSKILLYGDKSSQSSIKPFSMPFIGILNLK